MIEDVFDTISPVVEGLTNEEDEDAMDIDSGKGKKDDGLRDRILIAAIEAQQSSIRASILRTGKFKPIPLAFPSANVGPDLETQARNVITICTKANKAHTAAVSGAVFESLEKLFGKVDFAVDQAHASTAKALVPDLIKLLFDPIYRSYAEAVRMKRANAVLSLAKIQWENLRVGVLKEQLPLEISVEKVRPVLEKLVEAKAELS